MMKKGIYAILAALAVFALVMTGCPGNGPSDPPPPPPPTTVTITFDANGGPGTPPAPDATVPIGGSLTSLPAMASDIQGGNIWIFDGWYSDAAGTTAVDVTTTFSVDTTIYAKWDSSQSAPTTGKVAVIFNFVWPIAGTPDAIIAEVTKSTAIGGDLHTVTALQKPAGYEFKQWNTKSDGTGTEVTAFTDVGDPNPPLFDVYAIWLPLHQVSFNRNGGTGTAPAVIEGVEGEVITLPTLGSMVAPDRREFLGWSTKQKAAYSEVLTSYTVGNSDVILYAVWGKLAWPGTDATNTTIAEEISLANGWFAIYEFDLAGTQWSTLTGIQADYKLADASTEVRARVFGNFVASELTNAKLGTYTPEGGGEPVNVAVVGSWPHGDTGSWILDNTWPGNAAASTIFNEKNGASPVPADDTWFTVTYPKPGSNPHAQWSNGGSASTGDYWRYKDGRKPADTYSGKVYLGLGLSFGGGNIVTSQIKNVKLTTAGTTIPGKPVFFDKGGVKYRAYNGQFDDQDETTKLFSNTQGGKPDWDLVSGGNSVTVINFTEPATITVTYDANVTSGAELDDEDLVPEALSLRPGDRIVNATQLPALTATVTGGTGISLFQGWFTAATGGTKIIPDYQFDTTATIYGQWKDVADPIYITYNGGGATGSIAQLATEKNIPLTAAQLGKSGLTAPAGKASFGGWYTVDTTAGGFNPEDFTKIVTTSSSFTTDTTIYAYWYAAGDTTVDGITVEAKGGARIDKDGYVIFAKGAENAWLNANANDTLLTFKFPDPMPAGTTLKITYTLKPLIEPTVTGEQVKDAGFVWKKPYDSWTDAPIVGSSESYTQYSAFSETPNSELTKALADFESASGTPGVSIQINGGNDGNKIRAGYVYGIKITAIAFE
jgi:hypothetical protein